MIRLRSAIYCTIICAAYAWLLVNLARGEIITGTTEHKLEGPATMRADRNYRRSDGQTAYFRDYSHQVAYRTSFYTSVAIWDTEAGTVTVPELRITLPEISHVLSDAWVQSEQVLVSPGMDPHCDLFGCYPGTPPVYETVITDRIDWSLEVSLPPRGVTIAERTYDVLAIGRDRLTVADPPWAPEELLWTPMTVRETIDGVTNSHEFDYRIGARPEFLIERDESGRVTGISTEPFSIEGQSFYAVDPDRRHRLSTSVNVPEPRAYLIVGLFFGLFCVVRFVHGRWVRR